MGREIKRVPLDFDWPLNEVWRGFVNPYYKQCPECGACGTTAAQRRLESLVALIMISGEDAHRGKQHPYFNSVPLRDLRTPGPDMVELTTGLAGREPRFMGHDAIDGWNAEKKIIAAAGLDPETWGICPVCDGHGIDPDLYEAYEAWEPADPPQGNGYQVWEAVSEGSPISPVFATPQEVIDWLVAEGYTRDGAAAFVKSEWAPSMVMDGAGVRSGIDAMATPTPDRPANEEADDDD